MAKIAFAILGMSLMLNFATGLLLGLVPEFQADVTISGAYTYDEGYSNSFVNGLEQEVKPSGGAVEDKGSALWRVLDMINIGFISKIFQYVLNYLYGFVKFIGIMLSGLLAPDMWRMLFSSGTGIFYIIMHIVYITAGISVWTGRDLSGR